MGYKDPAQRRAYNRVWIASRRASWMEGKACIDCGSTDLLEVDHVDPTTKVSHAVWSWSESRRNEELAKCVVRCRSCHNDKSIVNGDCGAPPRMSRTAIEEIIARYQAGGVTQEELAAEYGCRQSYVSKLVNGERRKYR